MAGECLYNDAGAWQAGLEALAYQTALRVVTDAEYGFMWQTVSHGY